VRDRAMCAAQTNRSETGNASACDHESKQGQPFRLALCLSRCQSNVAGRVRAFEGDAASPPKASEAEDRCPPFSVHP
jgi:hypothetical protein